MSEKRKTLQDLKAKSYEELVSLYDKGLIDFKTFSQLAKKVPLGRVELDKGDIDNDYL